MIRERNIMKKLALAAVAVALATAGFGGKCVEFPFEDTVIVSGMEPTAAFAAKELNDIAQKSCGKTFKIAKGDEKSERRIFIGRSPESERILGAKTFEELGTEESAVFAKGNDLFLIGGDPIGVLWAVYDFCEDSMGYRWYLERDDGEKIVKSDVVKFNGAATRRKPKLTGYRKTGWGNERRLFRLRNRSNSDVRHFCPDYVAPLLTGRVPGHGFMFFFPEKKRTGWHDWAVPKEVRLPENAFRDHPEWFSLMPDGKRKYDHQLCLSNKGCRKELTRVVLDWMKVSGPGLYQVGVNDSRFGALCHCADCKALSKKHNTNGGPLWDYVLELCAEVSKTFPQGGYYVHSLAYDGMDQTEKAPDNITFPENFVVDLAYIHVCDRPIKQLPDKKAPEGEMVNYWRNTLKWCSITKHQSYWLYGTASPMMIYRRMQKEIKELAEAGVESVFTCGHGGGYEFKDITGRLAAKLLFDPGCDVRKELEEAVRFKYGPAAQDMLEFMDSMEETAIGHIANSASQVLNTDHCYQGMNFIPGKRLAEWRKIFERAEPKVKGQAFYEENVRHAKIVVDLFTVILEKRIREEAPDCRFDVAKVRAEGIANSESYAKKFLGKGAKNEAKKVLVESEREYAYYGNLKDENALPGELAGYQASFVTRILPIKNDPFFCGGIVKGKYFSEEDPQAACGYRVVDTIPENRDLSGGVPYYIWDAAAGKARMPGKIPLSAFRKGEYSIVKLGETELSGRCSFIFTELWASPLAYNYLGRCFSHQYPKRRYEIFASVKAEGPKFFPGDEGPNRLSFEQLFVCEVLGSGN